MPPHGRDSSEDAELRTLLLEVREMLVKIRQDAGDARAGARDPFIHRNEKLIRLEEAAELLWGRDASREPGTVRVYAEILRDYATVGFRGVILETTVKWKKSWYTSYEAMERFMLKAFQRPPAVPKSAEPERSTGKKRKQKPKTD